MTVERADGRIILTGHCGVEEAETLLAMLLEDPSPTVSIETETLHTGLWQVLLAIRPPMDGRAGNKFVREHLLPRVLDRTALPVAPAPEKR